ncbi:hypothetical protein E3N88_07907 [Mikania micrantha]|uniref:Protein kinase domain-containing protein n=1 Tax=Mikania micrantha TaxID=192012 RepID=A0A5N6PF59_9ASTR|nr:hypothetical protein E3N88_07907 [Mikania micrantha]
MGDFIKEFDIPPEHSSEKDLRKLRDAISLLRKRERRFRRVSDLEKPSHHDLRREIQEKIRVSLFANKALDHIQCCVCYLRTNNMTPKYDVYSFGVILFEVLCGRKLMIGNDGIEELIVPNLRKQMDKYLLRQIKDLAYKCVDQQLVNRPTMDHIVEKLEEVLELQRKNTNFEHSQADEDTPSIKLMMELLKIPLSKIRLATNNFHEDYLVGRGGYGKVYKVELDVLDIQSLSSVEGMRKDEMPRISKTGIAPIARRRYNEGTLKELIDPIMTEENNDHMFTFNRGPNQDSFDTFSKIAYRCLAETQAKRPTIDVVITELKNALNLQGETVKLTRFRLNDIKLATKNFAETYRIGSDTNSMVYIAEIDHFGSCSLLAAEGENNGVPSKKHINVAIKRITSKKGNQGKKEFFADLGMSTYYVAENDKGLAPIVCQCFNDGTIGRIMDPRLKQEPKEDIFIFNRGPNEDSLDKFLKIAYQCLIEAAKRPTMENVIKELEIALNLHEKKIQISRKDIESGTKNFSEKHCVGSGRFWKAYKGELPFLQDNTNANASGYTTIVAKRWDNKFSQGDNQFQTEVNILCKRNHENIIGLVGYCNEADEKIIVYEHMYNGSLDKYLKDANLTWMKRLAICIDVANGLDFLHQGGAKLKKVVHRDIKSCSILLNDDWKAKISNLELSSLDPAHQDMEHVSDNAYATLGYLDPEYKQGFLTEKSDIYSLGVVLFEILCGRLASEDHSQFLGPLAKRCYEDKKLHEIVFEGIKDQIGSESLKQFADIAYQCLQDRSEVRPTAHEVVIQLKIALNVQKEYEKWEAQLPEVYKEIIRMSKTPEVYSRAKRKDLQEILSKGILIQDGKVWVSLGSNEERNEIVSASQFLYENQSSNKWLSVPESRFDKIAEMSNISNLNIRIKIRIRSLSSGVNYGVHLVFKFCGARKSGAKPMYVNLTYKMGNETLHAYFATQREDEWMMIELYRFLNHNGSDTIDFEFLLESFSKCYCGNRTIYVEGVEFRAIGNVKPGENNFMEVQQVITDPMQQLQTNDVPSNVNSLKNILKFKWRKKKKPYYMLPAHKVLWDCSNAKLFNLKLSTESRFEKVIELLSTQVFRIKCNIESKKLENTEYSCYLVFKLSEKRCGLHCPVIVRDLNQRKNEQSEFICFRSLRLWNIVDVNRAPQEREDGWMEVYVWKFKSNHKLQNDCISMNLKFVTYEGTLSGLILCGLEFRPV